MNHYEHKQQARRDRYERLAEKARAESRQRRNSADAISERFYGGQPILVGHHSEKSARAARRRMDTNMRKGIEEGEKADYYAAKASSVGRGGISSDDPDAVDKLSEKLEQLKAKHERMKLINRVHKSYTKDNGRGECLMEKHCLTEAEKLFIRSYRPRYSWEPHPYPPYRLTNNLANIKRIAKRIITLETTATQQTRSEQIGAVTLIQNVEENRVQLLFPGKPPDDIREMLKRNGFRWSRLNNAWQRHLTRYAIDIARDIAQEYEERTT